MFVFLSYNSMSGRNGGVEGSGMSWLLPYGVSSGRKFLFIYMVHLGGVYTCGMFFLVLCC